MAELVAGLIGALGVVVVMALLVLGRRSVRDASTDDQVGAKSRLTGHVPSDSGVMAEVDPENDRIWRFVVWHYRYDSERRERRNMVVAAFDNEREFKRRIDDLSNQLKHARATDAGFDPREGVSGVIYEPGYRTRQKNQRLLRRAIFHGEVPRSVLEKVVPASWIKRHLPPVSDSSE